MNCGSLLTSALVAAIILVAAGHPEEKLASCCKKVNKKAITEPILDFLVQEANPPCVKAVIFQTESGLYCSQLNAPWVLRKIRELRRNQAQLKPSPSVTSPSSSLALLSIITSTASPPPSSSLNPASTSESITSSTLNPASTSESITSSTLNPASTSESITSSTLNPASTSESTSSSAEILLESGDYEDFSIDY